MTFFKRNMFSCTNFCSAAVAFYVCRTFKYGDIFLVVWQHIDSKPCSDIWKNGCVIGVNLEGVGPGIH
jgi:hypothetical protein